MTETPDPSLSFDRLGRRVRRRLINLPSDLAYSFSKKPMKFEHRTLWRSPDFGPVAAPLADVTQALRTKGVAITSLAALGADPDIDLLAAGRAAIDSMALRPEWAQPGEVGETIARAGAIAASPSLYRWGVGDRLMQIARDYIDADVGYDGVKLSLNRPSPLEVGVRRWHRDMEDMPMLKVGVYLNDVDGDGGPFQLLNKFEPGDIDPFYFKSGSSAEIMARYRLADITDAKTTITGKAGTVFFVDTSRFFHRMRPVTGQARSSLFYTYFSRRPQRPYYCERNGMAREQLVQMIEGCTPAQRDAALWRDNLHPFIRLIRPAIR